MWIQILNYFFWYLFVFIGVVWVLVLFKHQRKPHGSESPDKNIRLLTKPLPKVSVLIPAYNEEKTIAKTIKSILSLDYPRKLLEVIVINDCSKDRTGQIAGRFSKKGMIKLLNNKVNRGKGYSLNKGIFIARGELVVCMDADSIVEADALKKMAPYFEDRYVGAVTPALRLLRKKNKLEMIQHIEYIFNVFFRKMLGFLDAIHVTPGAFSIYRKSVIQKIGGFDEKNLTEDMDIALRIHKAGYKIENELNAVSYTKCPNKWKELFKQRLRWYRGAIHNSAKHRDILFNRKHGNLGMFYMPINVLAIIAIIFIFISIVCTLPFLVGDYFYKFSLINWDVGYMIASAPSLIFNMFTTPFFLLVIGLILGVYIIFISFDFVGEKHKGKISYVFYLLIYPITIMLFWTVAFFYEIFRIRKKW